MSDNIVIISHPRSGSYWFQECVYNHYNMDELFNIENISEFFLHNDRLVPSAYYEKLNITKESAVKSRKLIFENISAPKCVKIHWMHFNKYVRDWILEQKSIKLIFLERRSKESAFKSLLISNYFKKYVGNLPNKEVTVNLNSVLQCYNAIFSVDNFLDVLKLKFNYTHYFYEDALKMQKNEWFNPSNAKINIQHSLKKIKILNYSDVQQFLKEKKLDVSDKQIF